MSFNICLSHDVDRVTKTFQYGTHALKALSKGDLNNFIYHVSSFFQKQPYWQFDRIIEIENKYKVKSSFYILNESLSFNFFKLKTWPLSIGYYNIHNEKLINTLKHLDNNGWEIGVHGSYNSYNNISLLKKEKKELEELIGHKVDGIRQHFLNLSEETWSLHKKAGFLYDASFGYKKKVGFKNGKYLPFTPSGMSDFTVVPLSIMDSNLMSLQNPWKVALKIIEEAEQNQACLVINWHQRVFNEKEFPGYSELYIQIIEECKKRNANFHTIGEYVKDKISQQSNKKLLLNNTT